MQLNLLPTVQQAITNLLTVYEPEFLRFGYGLFLSFATILIVWQGIRMMFSHDGLGDQMFEFAKLLMLMSFGYAMITFYEAPIPGFGVSFSNLITDQAGYFQSVLEARAFDNIYRHFDELADHFMQPDAWSILANLIYWTVLLLVALAKALSLAVIAFGLIASAVCGLLGPIFVPFFVVPKLEWLFWGWLKSFIQYSFIPVVAIAFLMIFEQFVFRYVTTLPPTITSAEYGVYALQAVAVIATFCVGMVMVPSLTNSIFSGHGQREAPVRGALRLGPGPQHVLEDRSRPRLPGRVGTARPQLPHGCEVLPGQAAGHPNRRCRTRGSGSVRCGRLPAAGA